ncbi:PAS domain-containing protein [Yoonia litorea]|uniref:PAS domain S-box-containing protein n=1 Tax=Yoonia litorea TaxID=1123755 RepID=A0A1I6LUP1_9RHOB|nr:PAS domain-containing protein [Yoonia litorea]SFS07106.1 PAS domain S-box-containing protein [Yoonia litorea]
MQDGPLYNPNVQPRPKDLDACVMQSAVPMVIADAALNDMPLVVINDAFCDMTGHAREDMIGQNCRILQPPQGMDTIRTRMRKFLDDDTRLQADFILPNCRKDGSRFLNLLYLSKLTFPGRSPLFLGSQFDITTQTTAQLAHFSETLQEDVAKMNSALTAEGWSFVPPFIALDQSLARIAHYELTDG